MPARAEDQVSLGRFFRFLVARTGLRASARNARRADVPGRGTTFPSEQGSSGGNQPQDRWTSSLKRSAGISIVGLVGPFIDHCGTCLMIASAAA